MYFLLKKGKRIMGRDYDPKQELLALGTSCQELLALELLAFLPCILAYTYRKITRVGSQFHFSALHYSEVFDRPC